ncbi:MAG: hypothetical protein RIA08_17840 [Roseovarius sp.]|uniref:hypothetical protein n=1 Tax=Roseovarius sp. TaxID=1486281 RepID=UPI0032EB4425
MNETTIDFWNTGLPLALIAGATVVLPFILIPWRTRSHRRVAAGMAVSAVLMIGVSAGISALFDKRGIAAGIEIMGLWPYVRFMILSSLKSALLWVPLLALFWFNAAQRVERLRGEDMARKGGM